MWPSFFMLSLCFCLNEGKYFSWPGWYTFLKLKKYKLLDILNDIKLNIYLKIFIDTSFVV